MSLSPLPVSQSTPSVCLANSMYHARKKCYFSDTEGLAIASMHVFLVAYGGSWGSVVRLFEDGYELS